MDMSTLHLPPEADGLGRLQAQWKASGRRMLPLGSIVAAHLILFYLAQSGMLRTVVHEALPAIMTVNFVAPPPPPPPSAPTPKTVDLTMAPPNIVPPLPPLPNTQVEPTITMPPPKPSAAVEVVAPVTTPAPTPPVPTPVPNTPHLVSGVEYINAPPPVYPAIARRMGESGVVLLRVLVNEKGLPAEVTVQKSSGSNNLDEAGRQTVLHKYLFKPYMEGGKAVSVFVLIPMNFQLS